MVRMGLQRHMDQQGLADSVYLLCCPHRSRWVFWQRRRRRRRSDLLVLAKILEIFEAQLMSGWAEDLELLQRRVRRLNFLSHSCTLTISSVILSIGAMAFFYELPLRSKCIIATSPVSFFPDYLVAPPPQQFSDTAPYLLVVFAAACGRSLPILPVPLSDWASGQAGGHGSARWS